MTRKATYMELGRVNVEVYTWREGALPEARITYLRIKASSQPYRNKRL